MRSEITSSKLCLSLWTISAVAFIHSETGRNWRVLDRGVTVLSFNKISLTDVLRKVMCVVG